MVSTPRLNRTVYSREPKLHTQVVTNRVINEKKKCENRDMIKYYSSFPKEVCGEIFLFNHYPFIHPTYLLVLNNLIFHSTLYIPILTVQALCPRTNATLIPTFLHGHYAAR